MSWFARIFHRGDLYRDLAEEMREHVAEKTEQLVREGMSREEAEHAARRAFGNSTLIEERAREAWQWPRLESLWADAKFALRQLRKSPGLYFPVSLDRNVLFFTLAVAAAAALLFGLAPLRSAAGTPAGVTMKTSAATANADRNRFIGRRILLVFQISLCLVLLVGAGLLFRTLRNLKAINLGMRADGL